MPYLKKHYMTIESVIFGLGTAIADKLKKEIASAIISTFKILVGIENEKNTGIGILIESDLNTALRKMYEVFSLSSNIPAFEFSNIILMLDRAYTHEIELLKVGKEVHNGNTRNRPLVRRNNRKLIIIRLCQYFCYTVIREKESAIQKMNDCWELMKNDWLDAKEIQRIAKRDIDTSINPYPIELFRLNDSYNEVELMENRLDELERLNDLIKSIEKNII
jgi:hypothetical protein